MKKLVLLWTLTSLPLLAVANPYGPAQGQGGMGGPGQGGMGGGGMQGGMQGNMQGGMHPPGPPAEFMSACKGKKEGDTATVNGPRGQMQGTCRLMFVPSQRSGQQGQGGQGGMGGQGSRMPGPGGMGQPQR
ncbi:MAG TPA: hypothetical protein VFV15_01460 [Moraxellaceae bacterium]|nr:hypothetical protein [Moraxellaceae bacterium]